MRNIFCAYYAKEYKIIRNNINLGQKSYYTIRYTLRNIKSAISYKTGKSGRNRAKKWLFCPKNDTFYPKKAGTAFAIISGYPTARLRRRSYPMGIVLKGGGTFIQRIPYHTKNQRGRNSCLFEKARRNSS